MADLARDGLVATFKDLLASGDYSDFVISCGSDTYNVHKAVICSRSGFFKRAERFPVGKESAEGQIDLPDDEPAVIRLLVQYMYEGEYEPKIPHGDAPVSSSAKDPKYHYVFPHTCKRTCPKEFMVCPHHRCGTACNDSCVNFVCNTCCSLVPAPPTGDSSQLLLHAQIYSVGDKYDVKGLQALAREKFLRACGEHWDSNSFVAAARYAFENTREEDAGLREIVAKTIAEHMELLNKAKAEELLNEFNGLAVGLLKRKAADLGWIRK